MPPEPPRPLRVRRLGRTGYEEGLRLQEELVRARREGSVEDTLLLLEHPHVITLGTGHHPEHVLWDEAERRERGVELFPAGRGGDVTYHGPGQLVGYPILDLKPDRCDLHLYLRDLEEMLIRVLGDWGLQGRRAPGMTGVWVGDRKLAAIGVRVSSGWITSHGFALNVDPQLGYFDSIVPCGIRDFGVGSIRSVTDAPVEMARVEDSVVRHFSEVFRRAPSPIS